jgi:hypothetical protein
MWCDGTLLVYSKEYTFSIVLVCSVDVNILDRNIQKKKKEDAEYQMLGRGHWGSKLRNDVQNCLLGCTAM